MNFLSWIKSILRPASPASNEPTEAPNTVPDLMGSRFSLDQLVAIHHGENEDLPAFGDVIIVVDTCGMGQTVKNERRGRVSGLPFTRKASNCSTLYYFVPVAMFDGKPYEALIIHMRRVPNHPGSWVIIQ